MPRLSEVYESAGVERERRLQERRRLDRQEHVQWWLAVLLALWVLGQAATLSLTVVTFGRLHESRDTGIPLAFSTSRSNVDPVAQFTAGASLLLGLLLLAVAALVGIVAFWNRRLLPTGWFLAGVFPWLILIVETAAVMLLVLELK